MVSVWEVPESRLRHVYGLLGAGAKPDVENHIKNGGRVHIRITIAFT